MNVNYGFRTLLKFAFLLPVIGCGGDAGDRPELGIVSGVVTLNGQPLVNAGVHFFATAGGRTASGFTGQDGRYEVMYRKFPDRVMGAKIGAHTVSITTNVDASNLEGVVDEDADVVEKVPARYRGKETILTANVAEGSNEINFDLSDDSK